MPLLKWIKRHPIALALICGTVIVLAYIGFFIIFATSHAGPTERAIVHHKKALIEIKRALHKREDKTNWEN